MIYIAAHRKFNEIGLENYIPLQVGAEGRKSLGYLADNTGDSISAKNPNFCELTGVYWIWKNTKDSYKGLVHYRRYFGKSNFSRSVSDIYSYDELVSMLDHADIVLPYVEVFKQNAREELMISCCTPEIFDQLRETVCNVSPDYLDDFDRFFAQKKAVLFNMMFCRREHFDDYCQWLFSILFELEKHVDLSTLNDYQKRLYGFLSERLLNVWVMHNHLNARNVKVVNTEMSRKEMMVLALRRAAHRFSL